VAAVASADPMTSVEVLTMLLRLPMLISEDGGCATSIEWISRVAWPMCSQGCRKV